MLKKTARLVQRGIPNHIEHFCFFFAKFKFSKHLREKNLFFAGGQNLPPVVNLLQEARERIYHNKKGKTCTESRRKEPRKRINHNKRGFGQTTGKSRFSSKLLVDCNTSVLFLTLLSTIFCSDPFTGNMYHSCAELRQGTEAKPIA